MEHTFLYEKALADKGIKRSQLPLDIKAKFSEFTALCKKLVAIPEDEPERKPEIDALDAEIDIIDAEMADAINKLPAPVVVTPPVETPPVETPPVVIPPVETPPVVTDPPAKEEETDNTGVIVAVLAVIGGAIWAGFKFFGGKQQ